jgi:putative transposase
VYATKERNVTDHLPERDRPSVQQRLRTVWALDDRTRALELLRLLAGEFQRSPPAPPARCAKASTRRSRSPSRRPRQAEARARSSTNPCESMIEIVRHLAQREAPVLR